MEEQKIVYIIHCIDTEGPLLESLEATFKRLDDLFGIQMEPTDENLKKIQQKQFNFAEKTGLIAEIFSSHNLNYHDTWDKLDNMLFKVMGDEYRNKILDSFGNGWIYNWHCVDHMGYTCNPRRRDLGVHNIFDHYRMMIKKTGSDQDAIHWHFHPMPVYKEAHRCATSYINSPHLYEILCRRIIERDWFPAISRAGFHVERPDSHWFMEQWIPFDASNIAVHKEDNNHDLQYDLAGGRFGDWRLAPDDWSLYQPSHDNYQLPGSCRRWICRCLPIMARGMDLTHTEVERAFARADEGKPTIMAITNHDVRNMEYEVDFAREKIVKASSKYPDVKFKFCEALEAFRSVIYTPDQISDAVELDVSLESEPKRITLKVETLRGKVFGPQPFLAVKTKSDRFIHENFDFDPSLTKWSYTFDDDSIRANDVQAIGVATNDKYGNTFVKVIKP